MKCVWIRKDSSMCLLYESSTQIQKQELFINYIRSNWNEKIKWKLTGLRRALYGESSNNNVLDSLYMPFSHGRLGSSFSQILLRSLKTKVLCLFSRVLNPVVVQWDRSCKTIKNIHQDLSRHSKMIKAGLLINIIKTNKSRDLNTKTSQNLAHIS